MLKTHRTLIVTMAAAALAALVAGGALAQSKGKIVCWKDKSGKVVGCGDTVPPEYRDSATKEMDSRGVTRKTTENAEERAKREAQEQEQAQKKAEEKKRMAEQARQDTALINTFTDVKEIDLKRDRDLQVADTQLTQLRVQHKNAVDREAEFKARIAADSKDKKPTPGLVKEELERAVSDKAKAERNIAAKEKEKEDIRKRYADMKDRYVLLKGGPAPAPKVAATPVAPTKK